MKELKDSFLEIVAKHRGMLAGMVVLFLIGMGLLVASIVTLRPGSTVVKVGYGDIGRYQGGEWSSMANSGGYHDGSWMEMLAFAALAVIFGIIHNLIVVKIYQRRNAGVASLFLMMSVMLVLGAILVMIRLLGEG